MTASSSVGATPGAAMADKAAQSADAAIQTARQKAHDAMDGISNRMKNVKDQASATLERFRPQIDSMANYAREEPGKALLISAAVGAGLMGVVALLARSGNGSSLPSASRLRQAAADAADSVRQAASESIDRLRKAAQDTSDDARSRASSQVDDARDQADGLTKTAKGKAKQAYDSLADTMSQWREQAGPIVDKIRPQLDNVMDYAKDDPAKALLLAAAAGAALMGLVSTLTK
ncbi:MAG TPA: hypothetical protein VMU47_20060 [Caldimonas sp.]|nr:hypothetical protein [Caldimonas sp.]